MVTKSRSGLKPIASQHVAAPSFAEAEIVIECQKIYWNDLNPVHFIDEDIYRHYPNRDFHRIYYGEIPAFRHRKVCSLSSNAPLKPNRFKSMTQRTPFDIVKLR